MKYEFIVKSIKYGRKCLRNFHSNSLSNEFVNINSLYIRNLDIY